MDNIRHRHTVSRRENQERGTKHQCMIIIQSIAEVLRRWFQKNPQDTTGAAKDTTPAGSADEEFKKMYNQVNVRVSEVPDYIRFLKTALENLEVKNSS
jgi:hypothetical protein